MASPFTSGSFDGWCGTGESTTYTLGQTYPDLFRADGEASLLSPVLTGVFIAGDLFTVSYEAGSTSKLVTLDCLDASSAVIATSATTVAGGLTESLSVPMPSGTARVRVTSGGVDCGYIYALEVPGLDVSPQSGLPSTNSIPSGWAAEAGEFTFSYASGVDSGDGNGSIMAISPTGGQAAIRTHTFNSIDSSVFYSIRCSIDAAASYSVVNCHYEAFDASDMQIGGGNIPSPVTGGAWVTGGFLLPPETSYIKIFVHGAPDQAFYLDGIHLPSAPAPATTSAYVVAPMPIVAISASEPGAVLSIASPRPIVLICTGANSDLSASIPTVRAFAGAHLAITAPRPTIYAAAHDSTGENAITALAPSPTLSFYTGAGIKAKAPSPTLAITGTTTNWVKASVKSPKPIVSATATVSGMMSAAIRAPSPNLVGYGGAVCSVTLTGRPTVQATATTGAVASIAVTCPLFQVESSATAQNHGSLHVIAPSPRMGNTIQAWVIAPMAKVTCIGTAVVTATYEAYAINLNHAPGDQAPVDEVTHYTNFPFNGIVRYQGGYYGWGADGLYLMEGAMDDANEIPYAVRTCIDDFKLTNEKNVVSAYFAGRIGPDMTVTLYAGEDGQASYNYHTANGSQARTHREKFARGVTDRYFAIGVSGKGALELADIELEINKLKRKT